MSIEKNLLNNSCDLKDYTTLKIGGRAEHLLLVESLEDLRKVLKDLGSFWYFLGNGSNLLIKDSPIRKPVIKLGKNFRYLKQSGGMIEVGAATILSELVGYCLKHNLSGLESLVGIPASLGGLIALNASAYGSEISTNLIEIGVIDAKGDVATLKKEDLTFGYRFSSLGERIVLWVRFRFSESKTVRERTRQTLVSRLVSQDFSYPSCGCVFKNPQGQSAGFLIDSCGLKGLAKGGAQVSLRHANFIINKNRASYADVDYLIAKIKSEVYKKYSIILEEEIKRWA